ncbi:hypothetical protein RD792_018057 [Penstemon davidsonii]|uniref:Protein kinase domain-containing protein n=1 Tax=Penstemon davidsonii TaxID=160366 RepID=A0ABR0DV46_9LAMI|nr:hypothetical protein RD792_018057 [Penstemon davidsonii]
MHLNYINSLYMKTSEASRISTETINAESSSSQPIEFEEIKKATKNFQPDLLLGNGGFGHVYKGWIHEYNLKAAKPGFGMAVAVKKWNPHGLQGRQEWMNELYYLSKLHHPNLVKLIGHCSEEGNLLVEHNMLVVYEFMPNGSLDNRLFSRRYQSLSWATRIKVATGAARALSFLHGLEKQVIHRGFNSGDILLDGEFNAKLSDFGLARNGPTGDMTHVSTRVMGTYGYEAPEYVATGHLTTKCDVYSFGVVLLESLTGRSVLDMLKARHEWNLVNWAQQYLLHKIKLKRIMDTKLEGQYPENGVYTVATVACKCIRQDPRKRPTMAEVLVALEQL